jgi:hypothetical protein
MTTTTTQREARVINALTTLAESARKLERKARLLGLRQTAHRLEHLAHQCDAAWMRLSTEGLGYLPVARVWIDTSADALVDHAAYVGRCMRGDQS